MIARTWRGRATAANADAYPRFFAANVVPELKRLAGHHGAWLLRREVEDGIEFLAVTLWESRASIKAFSGDDISQSRVEPAAHSMLSDFDRHANHYDVVLKIDRPA
jgi:heme-degrading monooxygenase HmoA